VPYVVINSEPGTRVEAYLYEDCETCKDERAGERRLLIIERSSMYLATYQAERLQSGSIGAKPFAEYPQALAYFREEQAYWRGRAERAVAT
jgi:hypothetical protein